MNDIVTLSVNGLDFKGWKSVRIEAGLERLSRSFELSVTDKWPGSVEQVRRIKIGDLCEVRIGKDLLCTGYVDATPIDYDSSYITIMIRGRSKTADLVDSSADVKTGQFKGLKIERIFANLAQPYGVKVLTEVDTGAVITDHQVQQGETVFESMDRLSRQRQVLITDNEKGDVVLSSIGIKNADSALELGVNVLSASAGFDFTDVYSDYVVKGQKSGTDDSFGAGAAQSQGTKVDANIKRKRVLVVRQDGQADAKTCANRAAYEQQIRYAKTQEIRYRVVGFRQATGALWTPNQMVKVKDAIMNVDATLLISECTYTIDDSGIFTELVVIPKEAFLNAA